MLRAKYTHTVVHTQPHTYTCVPCTQTQMYTQHSMTGLGHDICCRLEAHPWSGLSLLPA